MTTKQRETRAGLIEIRAVDNDGQPGVSLHVIRPGVVDDYGSLWNPHCFDESLAQRLPTLCWSHRWEEPLGPATGYTTSDDGPTVDFDFSDFDAVPMARRAHAQVKDGTIRDCSVGFSSTQRRDPTDDERRLYPGVREVIEKATLDEVSLVLAGAVPGAKVLAVRTAGGDTLTVDEEAFVSVARKVAAGEMTVAEGKAALELAAGEPPVEHEEEPPPAAPDLTVVLADAQDDADAEDMGLL